MQRTCYWCRLKLPEEKMCRRVQIGGAKELKWSCGQCPKRRQKKRDALDQIYGPLPSEAIRLPYKKAEVGDILGGRWRILAKLPANAVIVRRAG